MCTFECLDSSIEGGMLEANLIDMKDAVARYNLSIDLCDASGHKTAHNNHRLRLVQGVLIVQNTETQAFVPFDQGDHLEGKEEEKI